MKLRVGTRRSPLARMQTELVCAWLQKANAGLECDIVLVETTGDRIHDRALREVGGKGLFVKELDEALSAGSIDCAVHSLKDVPSELPVGITLACVPERRDPADVLICSRGDAVEKLQPGAKIGTTSLRRAGQVLARNPRVQIGMLRGNVETRLRRVREGLFDATLLAAAGIARLGVETGDLLMTELDPWSFVPAAGQGALGVTALIEAKSVRETLRSVHDESASIAVETERAVARLLGGSCDLPLGVFARSHRDGLEVVAVVVSGDGERVLRHEVRGPAARAAAMAADLAARLRADGAMALLEERHDS